MNSPDSSWTLGACSVHRSRPRCITRAAAWLWKMQGIRRVRPVASSLWSLWTARKGAVIVYNADRRQKYRRNLTVPEKYLVRQVARDSGHAGAPPCMPGCRAEKSGERATTCCRICCRACCRSRPARVPLVAGSRAPVCCTGRRQASSSLLCWLHTRQFRRTLVRRVSARGRPPRSPALVAPQRRTTLCSREAMKEGDASRRQSLVLRVLACASSVNCPRRQAAISSRRMVSD